MKSDIFSVLYIGQISKDKGVDLLVEAFSAFHERHAGVVRLLLAGNIEGNRLADELIDRVAKQKLTDVIIFLGTIENIPQLLNSAHTHICPSVCPEALSSVVGEAKQAHRPSIVFPSGGLPELICHKVDGYVCSGKTAEDILMGLEYYVSLPDWGKEHGEQAFKSMEPLGLTRQQFLDEWKDVYQI